MKSVNCLDLCVKHNNILVDEWLCNFFKIIAGMKIDL